MSEQIILKQCSKCKQTKSLCQFHKNRSNNDGYAYYCKECANEVGARYIRSKKGKAAQYRYRHSDKGRANQERYRLTEKYSATQQRYLSKPKTRAKFRRYVRLHPDRQIAANRVYYAIRRGQLIRPSKLFCFRCGKKASVYHHPNGYAPDHYLDVVPVCRPCQIAIHR